MRCALRALVTPASLKGRVISASASSSRPHRWCLKAASSGTGGMAGEEGEAAVEPPVRRKHVTTAFVQRPGSGKVLLVLRSHKVGTYRGQWGAVSGGVEAGDASLAARAQEEVWEEAGIRPSQLRLERGGRPLLVDDGRRHFAVHPFLFSLTDPEADVTLNWENDAAQWVAPEQIRSMDTAPQLPETWGRLALTPGQEEALGELAADRSRGAAELAAAAVAALQGEAAALAAAGAHAALAAAGPAARPAAAGGHAGARAAGPAGFAAEPAVGPAAAAAAPADGGGAAFTALRNYGWHLAACRPSMAAVANSVAAVLAAAHEELHSRADAFEAPLSEVCGVVQAAAATELRRLRGAAAAVQRQVAGLLRDGTTVMTISLSSSVRDGVKEAAASGMKLRAIICEARPLCEGVALAEAWAAAGVECTLVTDAQAGIFVHQADLVMVGADAVTDQGVVNKAGTRLLALAAHAAGVPVYAAADSGKLSPGTLAALAARGGGFGGVSGGGGGAAGRAAAQVEEGQEEVAAAAARGDAVEGQDEMAGEEVTAAWGRPAPVGATVRNVYFEATPLSLLTGGLLTEGGPLGAEGVAAALRGRRRQYRAAFQLP